MTCKSRHVHVFILAYKAHGKKNKENIKSRHTQKKHKVENHDKQIIRWERNDVRGNKNLQRYSAVHWGHLKVEVCLRRQDPDPSKKNKKKKTTLWADPELVFRGKRFPRKIFVKKNLVRKLILQKYVMCNEGLDEASYGRRRCIHSASCAE